MENLVPWVRQDLVVKEVKMVKLDYQVHQENQD
jgi:hypothetical protein